MKKKLTLFLSEDECHLIFALDWKNNYWHWKNDMQSSPYPKKKDREREKEGGKEFIIRSFQLYFSLICQS